MSCYASRLSTQDARRDLWSRSSGIQVPRWCGRVKIVVTGGSQSYQAAINQNPTRAMSWIASVLSVGSPKASPSCGGNSNAATPTTSLPRSNSICSEHASPCYDAPIVSQTPSERTWNGSSRLIRGYALPGTLSNSSTKLYEAENLDGANQAFGRFADLYDTGDVPKYRDIVDTIIAWGRNLGLPHQPTSDQRTHRADTTTSSKSYAEMLAGSPTMTITQH